MGTDDGEGPRRADRRRVRRLVCGLLVVSAAYSYWPSFLLPTGGLCNCATWSCVRRGTAALPVPPKFGFPHFYLGGGQKCGTTSLSHYIGEHPQVTAPWPKEPMVLNLHSLARTAATGWYIRQALHLPEVCEGGFETAAYDASANYLQKGNYTAEALRLINPEMKIVLIFREPLARAMSWLQHMAVKYPLLPNCLHRNPMSYCVGQPWFLRESGDHIGGSLYGKHLEQWMAHFPRSQILALRFEDMAADPGAVYARLLDFLGLDPYADVEFENSNPRSVAPYNMSIDVYRSLVNLVDQDTRTLDRLVGAARAGDHKSFSSPWRRRWKGQLAQCRRDGQCQVSLAYEDADAAAAAAAAAGSG